MPKATLSLAKYSFLSPGLAGCFVCILCALCPGMTKPPKVSSAPPEWAAPLGLINRLPGPPVADGALKAGEWDRASLFVLQSCTGAREEYIPFQSVTFPWAWAGYDQANLWICFVAPKVTGAMRAQVWIDPEGRQTSSIGFCLDERGRRQTLRRNHNGPLPSWQGVVGTLEDVCFFEVAIPLSVFAHSATSGTAAGAGSGGGAVTAQTIAGSRALINLALEIDAATSASHDADRLPASMAENDRKSYWRYCWSPAMKDPGFPGSFGAVTFRNGPTLRDAQVTLLPESLLMTARLQPGGEGRAYAAHLDVWRRGQHAASAVVKLAPPADGSEPFELRAAKLAPGLAEWMWTLTDPATNVILWRSPMMTVEVPSREDLPKTYAELTAQARAIEQRYQRLAKSAAVSSRMKNGMEQWKSKSRAAADALKDRSPEGQSKARKLLRELRDDLGTLQGQIKRAYIIPEPQSLVLKDTTSLLFGSTGDFRITQGTRLYSATDMASAIIAKTLQSDIQNRFGVKIALSSLPKEKRLAIMMDSGETAKAPGGAAPPKQSAYRMEVNANRLHIIGSDPSGLWNGTRSLLQLMRFAEGRQIEIPCLEIEDWPHFALRAAAVDAGGSQLLTPEYLKWLIDGLSDLKYNRLLVSLGDRYGFDKLGIGRAELTTEKIVALRGYARSRFISLIPMFDSFGRMDPILTAGYAPLRESAEDASTISPLSDKAEKFLDNCVDEIAPAFDAEEFHFGGRGGAPVLWGGATLVSRDLAEREGPGALMARHFNRLAQIARLRNLTPCFWADSLLERPESLAQLTPGVCLYVRPQRESSRFQPEVARAIDYGFPVVSVVEVCDARLAMRSTRFQAIKAVARYARERGSRGLCLSLIENAGDQYIENAWPALAYGADQMGPGINSSEGYFKEKLSWIWWNAETPEIVSTLCEPPAMVLARPGSAWNCEPGPEINCAPLETLLTMRPTEALVAMRRSADYAGLVAEARRVFGPAYKSDQRIQQLMSAGRRNDSHLLQAEFLERLQRHCATKILALDGMSTEYEAALRAMRPLDSGGQAPAAGRSLPAEVIRHLAAAENHCRALVYDYPYFREAFKRANANMGLRTIADEWVGPGSNDALRIYQAVESALSQARQGVPPPPLSALALGSLSAPIIAKRWPSPSNGEGGAAQSITLATEAPVTLAPGQSCYVIWETAGAGQARLTQARIVALATDRDDKKEKVLYEESSPREITQGAPRVIVWKSTQGFAATMLRFEARFSSAQLAEGSEILLTAGKLTD